jgi:hypothetical protein
VGTDTKSTPELTRDALRRYLRIDAESLRANHLTIYRHTSIGNHLLGFSP